MTTADPTNATASVLYLSDDDRPGVSKGALAIFFGIAAIYIGFRLWDLTGSSLWLDEIFALRLARLPWSELLPALAADKTTPPLFYAILKVWSSIGGESLLWLKLLPFFIAILNLVPFFFLCRELRLSGFGMNLALALMAPNSFLINYSQEVRMYSMLMLFTTVSVWMFVRYVNRLQNIWANIALLFIANLLLVFTHYFGWLVVGVEAGVILCLSPRRTIRLIAPALILLVLFAPWAYMVGRVATNEEVPFYNILWIERPDIGSVLETMAAFTGASMSRRSLIIGILLFAAPLAFWMFQRFRRNGLWSAHRVVSMLLALTVLPPVVVFLVSTIGTRSYWHTRYFIILAVPFVLLVAALLTFLRPSWVRTAFAIGVVAFAFNGAARTFQAGEFSRVKWDFIVAEITGRQAETAGVATTYAFEMLSHEAIQFYLEEANAPQFTVTIVDHSSQISDDAFWLVYGPRREANRNNFPIELLGQRGYKAESISTYGRKGNEVLLVRFTK